MQTLKTQSLNTTQPFPPDQFLTIDNVSKVYPTPNGPYTVLAGVDLTVREGEFICLIGHSGCGKSTLLNMVSGFAKPTMGEVRIQGQRITKPGPDRMVVFQNYALLPWKTAFENVYLGVHAVNPQLSKQQKTEIAKEHLEMVGLSEAMYKRPSQLSGGMKQRVAIARALAIRPEVLILDEPFGALDAITKEELQEELLQIWQDHRCTVLMITHDIDEALFLADRIVMMTNGPAANIGEIMDVPFTRPRNRERIMEDPRYYELRNEALDYLYNRHSHTEDDEVVAAPAAKSQSKSSSLWSQPGLKMAAGFGLAWVAGAAGISMDRAKKPTPPAPTPSVAPAPAAPVSSAAASAPSSSSSSSAAPSPEVKPDASSTTGIADKAEIDRLRQGLFDRLDASWLTTPTYSTALAYRVNVTKDGAIASYEPKNKASVEFVSEIPLPAESELDKNKVDRSAPTAQFDVVFSETGMLDVTPVSQ
jgi:nitrate/nitrite transport system ATP-binding protein